MISYGNENAGNLFLVEITHISTVDACLIWG